MPAPEVMFAIANAGVLPFWLLLAVAPFSKLTRLAVHAAWLPLALGAIYAAYIVAGLLSGGGGEGSFTSLEGVMALFSTPQGMLIGWIHYLVFDLFVGAWEVRDARRRGIPHLAVVPCLVFTLMLGPVGLAAYLLLRGAAKGVWTLDETVAEGKGHG